MKQQTEFETVIENLNQIYAPIVPNLSPFSVHLSTYYVSGTLTVELRKKWTVDTKNPFDKNKLFLKKLLTIIFSEKPIIAEIKIDFKDSFRQKLKLKSEGLL